eukprot:396144_1
MDEKYFNQMIDELNVNMNELENENENENENETDIKEEKEEFESEESESDYDTNVEIDSKLAREISQCKLCKRERGKGWSISVWVKHLNNKHIYKCNHCKYATTKSGYLNSHLLEHNDS